MKLEIKGGKFLLIAADGAKVRVISHDTTTKAVLIADAGIEGVVKAKAVPARKIGAVFLNGFALTVSRRNDWIVRALRFLGYTARPRKKLQRERVAALLDSSDVQAAKCLGGFR